MSYSEWCCDSRSICKCTSKCTAGAEAGRAWVHFVVEENQLAVTMQPICKTKPTVGFKWENFKCI